MRRFLISIITAFLSLLTVVTHAQLINPAIINIPSGTYMNVQMGLLNDNTGILNNAGIIILSGDYSNDGIFNSANYSFMNLVGPFQNINGTNSTTFSNLVIDGTDDKQCNVNTSVDEVLWFNNNKIIIGNNNLYLLPSATISGAANDRYVITNGTGFLVKESVPLSSDFLFPVGDAANSFKPVVLNYTGTVDTFSVRAESGITPTTGADEECVQYTFIVEERNSGGSIAALSLGWNTADEGNLFDRELAYMWQNNNAWHMKPYVPGADNNSPWTDWYYKASGITDFSSAANKFIIRKHEENEIFIPNIFSPNNDGNNDVLYIRNEGIAELEFVIYDRWGEKIFETTDVTQGWDGTYKGKVLSTAVFSYYVKATTYSGETLEKKGNVTLVR